ncbi:TetR/AcrR family transcriptional regulator [Bacillus sp. FJAT-42376]|uniref:TetR family transcriptional regulator n=1 Tax=Bacillus sp. FJAT-42376 TaxID=2014076 RepID=UPI000F50D090|nr:TetR family transcriptional regulator [Bacillus sp. FJAT-42376]AZB41044.1 TetR/AcrR family transcriptional regulator [Bacillus sp. FJAT-42376]
MAEPLTKEMILDAAEQVLRRFGPEKTSVVDVARVLNISHGTIYRHYPSKDSLKEAVAERWLHSIIQPLESVFKEECSSADRLYRWVETLISIKHSLVKEDPELFAMYTSLAEESVDVIGAHIEELIGQIIPIIQEGTANGEFESLDPEAAAKGVFFATAKFHHPAHAKEWGSPDIMEEFRMVWDLILTGIVK